MLRWNWLNSKVVVMNHAKTSDTINRELLVKFYTFGFPNFSLLPNKILAESQG